MKVIHFADLHIGVENYGKLNPESGLNTRLEDFLSSLDCIIDEAIKDQVDLVIFAGDAFKINEPTNTHQRVFAERIQRLSRAKIQTFLLIGNHDQTNKYGESHAMDIYNTLSIPYVTVSSRPEKHIIDTPAGKVQLVALPHVSKSALLTFDEFATQSFEENDHNIIRQVEHIMQFFERDLDPELPAILVAHVGIEQAKMGSEHSMSIGYGFTVPLNVVAREAFDYVALGHIHKHQILCKDPPVIYPGSVDRVDFGEEKEDKGYIFLELEAGQKPLYEFRRLDTRKFITIQKDLKEDLEPMNTLFKAIDAQNIEGAIVRVNYKIQSHRAEEVDHKVLSELLKSSFYAGIRPSYDDDDERIRMPELNEADTLDPISTLHHYLAKRLDLKPFSHELKEKAQGLWESIYQTP